MITFCLPSKNNLRYLKVCIPSIQQNSYYTSNKILVFIDEDTDGTENWLKENNIDYIVNPNKECIGIGSAYDTLFKKATTDMVMAFHTDMLLGYHADKYLIEAYKPKSVICSTRIEPPLHPPGPEKIIMDFGIWPEDINLEKFTNVTKKLAEDNLGRFGKSLFAPWLINRNDHLGHDNIFKSIYEDADLFRRFVLAEYNIIQSWSSLVYHLTCRSSKFEHIKNDDEFNTFRSTEWEEKNHLMALEYIRKWGGMFREYGPCEPKPNIKYNIGLKVVNCSLEFLSFEPYFDELEVDCSFNEYIKKTQINTSFDLTKKFVNNLLTDIIVEVDLTTLNINEFNYALKNIEELIEAVDENSTYEFGSIKIIIKEKKCTNIKLKLL